MSLGQSIKFDRHPELIFSLTGAIGTDLEAVQEALTTSLSEVGYLAVPIRISHLMLELKGRPWADLKAVSAANYYDRYIKAGNALRKKLKRPDALGLLAMSALRIARKKLAAEQPPPKIAFILHSFKRSEEVLLFRKVYGSSFVPISAYSPRSKRVERLTRILAEKNNSNKIASFRPEAEALVQRDENESDVFGQDIRKTYPLSDFFVNVSSPENLTAEVRRFTEILFGHPWHTPSRHEQGMAAAQLASCRSASPARQVGAAITDFKGSLISIGSNDVAKVGGGQYWEGDLSDGRDFKQFRRDTSDQMKENLVADLLTRLKTLNILTGEIPSAHELMYGTDKTMREAQVVATIDFVRAVHAEMNALFEARSRGLALDESILYTTTFPCHDCAKHIVTSGIRRVIYVEPYPKSLVAELFSDSIAVDSDSHGNDRVQFESFEGIAPRRYYELFNAVNKKRKSIDGSFCSWNGRKAFPQIFERYSQMWAHVAETDAIQEFMKVKKELKI